MMLLNELKFDELKIKKFMKKISPQIKEYITKNVIDEYKLNDNGHNINHINYVLKRAIELADDLINADILYVCVMYHDIACHINRDKHEILSADIAYNDKFLNSFFNTEDLTIIKEAIEDHRASLEYEPRNIYGKILSTADRKVEVKRYLIASMSFHIKKNPNATKEETINHSYKFAIEKFGKNGYAVNKAYVKDKKYEKFLQELQYLIDNKNEYFDIASSVYDEIN